jgi:hypothetical protein
MHIKILPNSINSMVGTLYITDSATPASTFNQASRLPTAVTAMVPNVAVKAVELSRSWSANAYFGGDILDNDNLQGTNAANPSEQSYYQIMINSADTAAAVSAILLIEIVYDAVWDELVTISTS